MSAAITIEGLETRHGDTVALTGLDLVVAANTSVAVIGPNGSGKSTLLGSLAGTLRPARGSVRVAGSRPALVLQSTDVDPTLPITVRDAVSLSRYPSLGLLRQFRARDRDAVDLAMRRVSIEELANEQLHDLSGGQRQRALLAQGLAQEAEVLLLDEPLTGLDVASQAIILDVIDDEVARGRTVMMTTHNLADARRADQVVLLDTAPVAVGTPDEVLTEEHLQRAFGSRFIRVGDELILDDPHHSH